MATNMTFNKNIFLSAEDDLNVYLLNERSKILDYWGGNSVLQRRWQVAQNYYYNMQNRAFDTSPGIRNVGLQGELKSISINEFRSSLKHIYSVITQDKLTYDVQAYNTDQKSKLSTVVGEAVLEYYFNSSFNFSSTLEAALEMSLIFGTAFVGSGWDENKGELRVDENGKLVFMGQPYMKLYSVYDVICCPLYHEWEDKSWVLTRDLVNKYELAAQYPEYEEDILEQPSITDMNDDLRMIYTIGSQDNIYVWNFYHQKSLVLPNGRYRRFLGDGTTIYEAVDESGAVINPYGKKPVFIMRPEMRYGHVWGYTPAFDLIPVQEAANNLDSAIITNLSAFAVQNVINPTGNGLTPQNLSGGLKVLNLNLAPELPNGGAPYALQLCAIPNDAFRYREMMSQKNNVIIGSNDAARGQQSGEASGTSVALSISQAQQANGAIQKGYMNLCEQVASFLLMNVIRTFQKTEQLLEISGRSDQYAVTIFKGDDLSDIARVKVSVGNPLGQTVAGRLAMAKDLASMQALNAQQYVEVAKTGDLKSELDTSTVQTTFIRQLGEYLLDPDGPDIRIMATDNHDLIIRHLKMLSQRMDVRLGDPAVLDRIEQKIVEAANMLEQLNANNPINLQIALDLPLQFPAPIPGVNSAPGGAPQQQQQEGGASQGPDDGGGGGNDMMGSPKDQSLQEAQTRVENLKNKADAFVQNAA